VLGGVTFLLAAVHYVELNPVQAGMVAQAWDYRWSSARFHMGKTESDPLDLTLSCLITDWEGLLAGGMAGEVERLRMATQTGR